MNQNRWHKIETIVDKALDLESRQQQQQFIRRVSRNNPQLYRKIETLMDAIYHAEEEKFLELD